MRCDGMKEIVNICLFQNGRTVYRIRADVAEELYEGGVVEIMVASSCEDRAAVSLRFQRAFTIMRGIVHRRRR